MECPSFLVDKKDGKKRLIADLRKTNLAVSPRVVALPPIHQVLDEIQLQRPVYFSTFDLFSGYFQILLAEESRDVTSVTAPVSGLRMRWTRAPFGLAVNPSGMLTVLNQVLGRLRQNRQLTCYMDDVCSGGRTFEELPGNMRDIFQAFRENNLKCNLKKCNFGATSIDYLGFRLTSQGLKITLTKSISCRL